MTPLFKRKFKGEFNFQEFIIFIKEIFNKYKIYEIRFHPEPQNNVFTEQHLTHISPTWTVEDSNGFIFVWKKYKNTVRKVIFDQFDKFNSKNKKIRMTIDLNNNFISLDMAKGINPREIENILEDSFGSNLVDSTINKKIMGANSNQTRSVGILNKGTNNRFFRNVFAGLNIGIQDEGENTEAKENIFYTSNYFKHINNKKINWTKWGTLLGGLAIVVSILLWYFSNYPQQSLSVVSKNQGGGITAGSVVINNNYSSTTPSNSEQKINILQIPIFDLARNYDDSQRTSIENEELFKKYVRLITKDQGFVRDVFSNSSTTMAISITENINDPRISGLTCYFNSNWTKTITTLKINQLIKFSGEIGPFDLKLNLENCKLE